MSITVYRVPDLVPILRMRKRGVRSLLTQGKLRGRIVGRQWLVTEESVRLFLEGNKEPAGGTWNYR